MLSSILQTAALPGIDPADNQKTFAALRFFHRLMLVVPVEVAPVSASEFAKAINNNDDDDDHNEHRIQSKLLQVALAPGVDRVSGDYEAYCRCVEALNNWAPQFVRKIVRLLEVQEAESEKGTNGNQRDNGSFVQQRLAFQLTFSLRAFFGQLHDSLKRRLIGELVDAIVSSGT